MTHLVLMFFILRLAKAVEKLGGAGGRCHRGLTVIRHETLNVMVE